MDHESEHQRDLVFIADGILMQRRGEDHAAFRGDPDRYRYTTWLKVFDDLNDATAGLRLLGADIVADDLRATLDQWRESDIRRAIKDVSTINNEPLAISRTARQTEAKWWGGGFFERALHSIELCREDIESRSPS